MDLLGLSTQATRYVTFYAFHYIGFARHNKRPSETFQTAFHSEGETYLIWLPITPPNAAPPKVEPVSPPSRLPATPPTTAPVAVLR